MNNEQQLSRRELFTKWFPAAGLSFIAFLTACNAPPAPAAGTGRNEEENLLVPPSPSRIETMPDVESMQAWIRQGRKLRTDTYPENDIMINNTIPGIDLAYFNNSAVADIRAIQNPRQRIMTAIGFLDVEATNRYQQETQGVYTCNIYALDLLRLVLGNNDGIPENDNIGSRYNTVTKAPTVIGESGIRSMTKQQYDKFNEANPFLDSNNLDWWMRNYGENFGWQRVTTQQELRQRLENNTYIALGATKREIVEQHFGDPNYTGHSFVLTGIPGGFGLTQSTRNISLEGFPFNSTEPKTLPEQSEYNFWVHELPPAQLA